MSPFALARGLPLSSDSSSASWSPFALIRSASAYIRLARFDGLTLRRGPSSAARAAAAARSTSSGPAKATSQIASPVAGSMVSKVRPSAASSRSPPTTRSCGPRSTTSRAAGERDWAVAVAIALIVACYPRRWITAKAAITSPPATGTLRYRQACPSVPKCRPGWWLGLRPRRVCHADVEDVGALEGLAAAVADHPAHRPCGQLARKPHAGGGAAGVVVAENQPHGFAGRWLGKAPVALDLHALYGHGLHMFFIGSPQG